LLAAKVKKRMQKRKQEIEDKEEGGVYKIECKDCYKIYIGETKFNIEKRIKQHMKEVEYKRTNNAIAKHVIETGHTINWHNTKWMEKEKRTIPRKLFEGCYIRNNRNICMHLNDGAYASAQYGVEGKVFLRRRNIQREGKLTQSAQHPVSV
jgi:GIY-YIG catalytic domain.